MAEISESENDKTLSTLCQCRNILLSKLNGENKSNVNQNLCERFICENEHLIKILNKLHLAKESLNPVIEEIISSASKLTSEDYKNMRGNCEPICSVTTAQFAGAVEASKLLYEINEHLNDADKHWSSNNENQIKNEFTVNTIVVPEAGAVPATSADRIFIDKELMQQLIELHDLLGDTIKRLRLTESGVTSATYSQRASKKSSRFSYCGPCKKAKSSALMPATSSKPPCLRINESQFQPQPQPPPQPKFQPPPQQSRPQSPRTSQTLIRGSVQKSPKTSNTSLANKTSSTKKISPKKSDEKSLTFAPLKCDLAKCPDAASCPIAKAGQLQLQPPPHPDKKKIKLKCCPKKTKSQIALNEAKKKKKQEEKLKKKLEKQRQNEMKRREKEAKRATKGKKPKQTFTCCKKKTSKSATYIRDGATAPVHNINDAKKKILDCLGELSNIHTFLNSEERVEIDLENQLQLVGDIKNRDCCNRNFPHLHATLNGIPIILQLNKETVNLLKKQPSTSAKSSKCRCGPTELPKCPLHLTTDLDYTPISQKVSKNSVADVKASTSKTKSMPSVASKQNVKKDPSATNPTNPPKEEAMSSSAVLWKHPQLLSDLATSSLTEAEILTTPQTSITVFSTKKTKDGQKVRLSLTISPIGAPKGKGKQSSSYKTMVYDHRQVIPEKDSSMHARKDGFETDESDPGMPYLADNTSLPDFNLEEQKTRTTLTNSGIAHPDYNIQKELQEMGIENLLKVCRPAKCCRKTVINEKPRNALPYPASLMSLPLDREDLNRIKEDLKRNSSNSKCLKNNFQTFNFETYTKFQSDDKLPWKIQTMYEVRFFDFLRMDYRPPHQISSNNHRRNRAVSSRNKQLSKQLLINVKNEDAVKSKNKNDLFNWLPNREFSFNIFDIIRKKQRKNAVVQTANDEVTEDIKIITPTIYKHTKNKSQKSKNVRYHHRPSQIPVSINRHLRSVEVNKRMNDAELNQFLFDHDDIACFSCDKTSHRVHFHNEDISRPSPEEKVSKKMIAPRSSKGKLVESNSKTRPKSKESVGKKQQNDSLLKLIPLQPYLVQKIDENNSNVEVRSSKSTVYNPGVDKVDSRIVYKKHQSEDLYYISSLTGNLAKDKKINHNYTSLYKNSIFYPYKLPEFATYYNTIITSEDKNNGKIDQSKRILKNWAMKPCKCKNVDDNHSPESLETFMLNGQVPCNCSKCSMQACEAQTSYYTKPYTVETNNKLVAVNSNKSLESNRKEIEQRHKKTIIKSSRTTKQQNSKLVGHPSSADFNHEPLLFKRHIDQCSSTISNYLRNADKAITSTKAAVNETTSTERPKPNIVKEAGTNRQSFTGNVRSFVHKEDSGERKPFPGNQPSFNFQCDDEIPSNPEMKARQFPKIANGSISNFTKNTRSPYKSYPVKQHDSLHVASNSKNPISYAFPKNPNTPSTVFKRIANSNIPRPYTENSTRNLNMNQIRNISECYNTQSVISIREVDLFAKACEGANANTVKCDRKLESFGAPIKNKRTLLQKSSATISKQKDDFNRAKTDKILDRNKSKDNKSKAGGTDFAKLMENLNTQLPSAENKANRGVTHAFSSYSADIDGKSRPGYLSVLKPTCGCPEITVFIPCYCDDNTILGK